MPATWFDRLKVDATFHLPLFLIALSAAARAEAADDNANTVSVTVASGRRFSGVVDPQTSPRELVLRSDWERSAVRRPIAWSRVTRVDTRDKQFAGTEFQAIFQEFVVAATAPPVSAEAPAARKLPPAPATKPSSLWADARVANLDRDADEDGLILQLLPLDGEGRIAPSAGSLRVELFAQTGERRPSLATSSRGPDVKRPLIEVWTRELTEKDFSHDGAFVRLFFAGENPANDPHLRSFAAARVTYTVVGVDQFETIIDPIRVKPLGRIGIIGR